MPLKQGANPFPGANTPFPRPSLVTCRGRFLFAFRIISLFICFPFSLSLSLYMHTLLLLFIRNIFSHLHKQKGNNCHVFLYYRPGAVEPFCGFRTVSVFIDLILMGIFATGENRRNLSIITAPRDLKHAR